jgi:glycolate oxidase FAD binding subunit
MASTRSDLDGSARPTVERPLGVDGRAFAEWTEPVSATELASILSEASGAERAVTPVGGGTKLALGNVPKQVELALSTARLDRVLHYEPTDMTLSVEAGIGFAEIQAILADRGQSLPVETADAEHATVGGMIATALAGPRRLGCGTLRDLLIGIAVAYPDGSIGKAGGLVVKNVTGFDLMRLHLGALGTLGVVVSANLKVLPLARSEATLVLGPRSLPDALRIARDARQGRLRPIALEIYRDGAAWSVAARFEGRPQTVALGLDGVRSVADWRASLDDTASKTWWREYVNRQSLVNGSELVIRCGVSPRSFAGSAGDFVESVGKLRLAPEWMSLSPGLGLAMAGFPADALTAERLAALQTELMRMADTVTILKAPPAMKAELDVWGKVPETVHVMRSLKAEYDPTNTLNSGRFIDRI